MGWVKIPKSGCLCGPLVAFNTTCSLRELLSKLIITWKSSEWWYFKEKLDFPTNGWISAIFTMCLLGKSLYKFYSNFRWKTSDRVKRILNNLFLKNSGNLISTKLNPGAFFRFINNAKRASNQNEDCQKYNTISKQNLSWNLWKNFLRNAVLYSEVASHGKSHPTKTLASHKKLPPTKKLVSHEKIPPTKNSLMLGQSSHRLITLVACLHPCFLLPVFLSSDGGLDASQICSNALAPAGVPHLVTLLWLLSNSSCLRPSCLMSSSYPSQICSNSLQCTAVVSHFWEPHSYNYKSIIRWWSVPMPSFHLISGARIRNCLLSDIFPALIRGKLFKGVLFLLQYRGSEKTNNKSEKTFHY